MREHDLTPSDIERFWKKVSVGGPDECWIWHGNRDRDGYGRLQIGSEAHGTLHVLKANRIAFRLGYGRWPQHLACHSCDVRACVNPAHLFDGTIADNNRDMTAKGRGKTALKYGEENGRAKLTVASVREVRKRYAEGETAATLARDYGVHPSSIDALLKGRTWKTVR